MGGVTTRRANQVLRSLRRRSLIRQDSQAHVLSDEGLTYLARRDRAAVGPVLDRWTPLKAQDGIYFGTALRAIASQQKHQAGITDFAAQLSAEVARSPDHELLDLLPTQRSQISYRTGFRHFALHPDASFQLSFQGDWDWCLLEYERRATTPKRVPRTPASLPTLLPGRLRRTRPRRSMAPGAVRLRVGRSRADPSSRSPPGSTTPPSSAPTPRCSPSKESWASHGACRLRSRPDDGSCTTWGLSELPHPPVPSASCRGRPSPPPVGQLSSPEPPFCAGNAAST